MGPRAQRQSLCEAEDKESGAHLGEDVQQAAETGLLSMAGDTGDRVLGTEAPLTSTHVQCLGSMQQFIDEAPSLSKKRIDILEFTGRPSMARDEQGAPTCVEVAA